MIFLFYRSKVIYEQIFLYGKFVVKQEHRDEVVSILIDASKLVSTAKGCRLYVIGLDKNDNNSVYVTEIWNSKEDHDNSLKIEGVGVLINKTLPMLDGQPTKAQELEMVSGTGM